MDYQPDIREKLRWALMEVNNIRKSTDDTIDQILTFIKEAGWKPPKEKRVKNPYYDCDCDWCKGRK